ncbi:Rne/Rng family ribonuclease [Prolixibacter denitrificans]|uniref:Ribonuclease G n=1 Tax=Prolixibacter denitrificans TaxID=1541063 RepID=A0A2P8CCX2_9BACT|nr:Rne/Rng family ribonuclease [Prolixibacter denitrificans]PSK82815.1 ribonuclease G [Prolixibacter denitrificans]GET21370.1 ribonuclease G [Prolixibacter denitrificans]
MSNELIIDVSPSHVEIALLENKRLVELNSEDSNAKFAVGDIYLGKVKKIMPGLNAAFVDVGYEKDAFLHYLDLGPQFQTLNKFLKLAGSKKSKFVPVSKIHPDPDINKEGKITEVVKQGQSILVQIAKEPISTKGPRLTSEISVAGRNMVLMPFSDKVSVSQKIRSTEEKNRLKKLIQSIRPKRYGVIIRTAAEGKRVAELDQELKRLVAKFENAMAKLSRHNAPSLVLGELDRTIAMIRDVYTPDFGSIMVNDQEAAIEIKDYLGTIAPEKKKIVKYYSGRAPIFEHFGIDKQIKASFGKTVSFKSGAYLIIEHTEAFHVIDVNSGNRSKSGNQETNALEVNLAAADEIARQLRLRDMGGIIVIDFIDMHSNENRQKVFDKMKEAMGADRTKHNILPLSKFCLMQITRQRVRPEMNIDTAEVCPVCKGTGKVTPTVLFTDEIEQRVKFIFGELAKKRLTIQLHPFVAAFLTKGFPSRRLRWMFEFRKRVVIDEVASLNFLESKYLDENQEEIIF